ncbi:hypothetical protein D3C83_220570 [compost metagenome]
MARLGEARLRLAGRLDEALQRLQGSRGTISRPSPTASMAMWVMLMLGGCLVLYYA